jgi:uncharacterized protein
MVMETEKYNDFEVRSLDAMCVNESQVQLKWHQHIKYVIAGAVFGILLVKSEVVSWFRIQEMFRFQSFHMYGVIGSAVAVGMFSVWLIKRFDIKTLDGEKVVFPQKKFNKGQVYGGLLFGLGWALAGNCPGPIYALIGAGAWPIFIVFLGALLGTWVYGLIREKLPH